MLQNVQESQKAEGVYETGLNTGDQLPTEVRETFGSLNLLPLFC